MYDTKLRAHLEIRTQYESHLVSLALCACGCPNYVHVNVSELILNIYKVVVSYSLYGVGSCEFEIGHARAIGCALDDTLLRVYCLAAGSSDKLVP